MSTISETPREPHPGRQPDLEHLTPVGELLWTRYLTPQRLSYRELAQRLGLPANAGEQSLARLCKQPQKTFPQISLRDLVSALHITPENEEELRRRASASGLRFSDWPEPLPVKALAVIRRGTSPLEAAQSSEPDLIELLHCGRGIYVRDRARPLYEGIKADLRLTVHERKQWMLRLARLIEQAQEVSGQWHGARVLNAARAHAAVSGDMAELDKCVGAWDSYYFEEANFAARMGVLWRETYRDDALNRGDTARNAVRLRTSDGYFASALGVLEGPLRQQEREVYRPAGQRARYVRDLILRLAIRCQQLHAEAIEGNPAWIEHLTAIAAERDLPLTQNARLRGLRTTIIEYFKGMGYKRLAWASRARNEREWSDPHRRALQRAYATEAQRHIESFRHSEYMLAAWRAQNFDSFDLLDEYTLAGAPPTLIADKQVGLLYRISTDEGGVWLGPAACISDALLLKQVVDNLFPSASTKLEAIRTSASLVIAHS